jgi:hypothetical protein
MSKLFDRIWDGLSSAPLQTVAALIIFLLALPLIRAGFRDRPPSQASPPSPPSTPIEIESPWFVQNFLQMQNDMEKMVEQLGLVSSKVDGLARLLKRRAGRKPTNT